MSSPRLLVLDASVGVKWFRPEPGQDDAIAFVERAAAGEFALVAPAHFTHEVLAVVRRTYGAGAVLAAWEWLVAAGVSIVPLTREVVAETASQCEALECSFHDGLGPACAALLGATLASANASAHGDFDDVLLVGVCP